MKTPKLYDFVKFYFFSLAALLLKNVNQMVQILNKMHCIEYNAYCIQYEASEMAHHERVLVANLGYVTTTSSHSERKEFTSVIYLHLSHCYIHMCMSV